MASTYRRNVAVGMALFVLAVPGIAIAGEAVTLGAPDDVSVYGTLTRAEADSDKIALLFHQARANRHEYDPVVPMLDELGYDTLAIDQRAGGDMFGGTNKTAAGQGGSADYLDALPDLEAALEWAQKKDYETIVTVGSSYSASLVLVLAARHPQAVDAVASFSPGEYFDDKNLIKNAAAEVTVPVYITAAPDEADSVDTVLEKTNGDNVTRYTPEAGVHGASTLVETSAPQGYEANRQHFADFLRGLETADAGN